MKNKFYISAVYTSTPKTMGGNTKIVIELINNLINKFDFVIFTTEPKTFKLNLKNYSKVKIVKIPYPFRKFNYFSHMSEINHITNTYLKFFSKNKINKDDYFLSASDFAPDVLPIHELKGKYNFKWIGSLFLFIPTPLENLIKKYNFPFIKYVIYHYYQKYVFSKILKRADFFLITNEFDSKFFPSKLKNKIFAIYGGVNPEELSAAKKDSKIKKEFDAVFCSRLHPQKGISQLLESWSLVLEELPFAKIAIIGNGGRSYEKFLKNKAKRLKIDKNIKWFGYVNGINKYKIYLKSKIFLHGTIFDNNGMVATEALCSGLKVVMYDLPQLAKLYSKECVKVKVGSKKEYAKAIIKLLKKKEITYSDFKFQKKLLEYWSWKNRIGSFYNFLK